MTPPQTDASSTAGRLAAGRAKNAAVERLPLDLVLLSANAATWAKVAAAILVGR